MEKWVISSNSRKKNTQMWHERLETESRESLRPFDFLKIIRYKL
jgi:hypothetical protein